MTIVVSTGSQHLKVYNAEGRIIAQAPVSTGQPGRETPHGVFSILAKEQMHHSNLYDDAPMPWMERITWSGVALHAGNLPGYAASHGCIRLPYNFSRSLYALTRIGTRVIVSRNDLSPRSFAHAGLFAPLPTEAALAAVRSAQTASAGASAAMQPSHLGGPDAAVTPAGLLGITPANASETRAAVRTREQAAAERVERIEAAKRRLEEAEASRAGLEATARTATEAAQKAHAVLHDEKAEGSRIDEARRKLLAEIGSVKDDIAALARLARKAGDELAVENGADREQALEDKLAALGVQALNAQGVVATQADLIASASVAADAAQARQMTANADLKKAGEAVIEAKRALEQQQKAEANRARTISIFVSRKAGKLYVRQGFDEMFEAPIAIDQPELPVGTHVFTAVGETDDTMALRWSVLTVQSGQVPERSRGKRSRKRGGDDEPAIDADAAAAASTPARVLERLKVSPDVRERIAEFIKPGSSLIVSDHGLSHETGRGTEFVILTR